MKLGKLLRSPVAMFLKKPGFPKSTSKRMRTSRRRRTHNNDNKKEDDVDDKESNDEGCVRGKEREGQLQGGGEGWQGMRKRSQEGVGRGQVQ